MDNQITCPHCQRIIFNNPIIDDVAKREGSEKQFLVCECGQRITYWQITAQLRDQNKPAARILNWFRDLSRD
jgi:hypothetical protein